jgi:hypothetical protein
MIERFRNEAAMHLIRAYELWRWSYYCRRYHRRILPDRLHPCPAQISLQDVQQKKRMQTSEGTGDCSCVLSVSASRVEVGQDSSVYAGARAVRISEGHYMPQIIAGQQEIVIAT